MLSFLATTAAGLAREPAWTEVAVEVPVVHDGGVYVSSSGDKRASWIAGGVRVARWTPVVRGWWAIGGTLSTRATAVFVGGQRDQTVRQVDLAVDLSRTTTFGAVAERRISPTARIGVGVVGRVANSPFQTVAGGPQATVGFGLMLSRAPARPFLEVGGTAGLIWPSGSPTVDCYTGPCTYSYWEDHELAGRVAFGVRL